MRAQPSISTPTKKPLNKRNLAWQFRSTAQSQIIGILREEAAVARMAAILPQLRFDSRTPQRRGICKKFSLLNTPGRPRSSGFTTAPGIQSAGVSGVALPLQEAPVASNRPRLIEARLVS